MIKKCVKNSIDFLALILTEKINYEILELRNHKKKVRDKKEN